MSRRWHLKPFIMHTGRGWAAAAPTNPDEWVITGGYNGEYLNTAELFVEDRCAPKFIPPPKKKIALQFSSRWVSKK